MRELFAGSLKQGDSSKIYVLVLDSSGNPVLGLTDATMSLSYLRTGDIALNVYPLIGKITELSNGLYRIDLNGVVTAYIGPLRLLFTGVTFDDFLLRYDIQADLPGNVQVTLTVEDSVSTPFSDVQVDIWNDAQTLLLWSGITDINGQIVTALNPGTYKVLLRKNRVSFTVPETLTVVGPGAETKVYIGTELSFISPTVPGTCVIYGDIYDIDGTPDDQMSPEAIVIRAVRTRTPIYVDGKLLTIDPHEVRADQNGHFEITLIRGMQVTLEIPRIMWRRSFTVPDQASENLINLL